MTDATTRNARRIFARLDDALAHEIDALQLEGHGAIMVHLAAVTALTALLQTMTAGVAPRDGEAVQ